MNSNKREKYHHGDLRTALLEMAAEMIAEGGLESVTLRALGQRVGVSRTAPYRHFTDKSALLAAVAEEGFKRFLQRLQAIEQQSQTDPLIRFQQMGVAYIQFAADHPTHYRLMFYGKIADFEAYPGLAAASKAVFDTLVTAIQQCQAAHKIKSGEPRALAYVAWALVHGLASLLIDNQIRSLINVQELTTFTVQNLIHGMTVK